ncbi:hypothetical protein DUI87_30356 [Hirundo rustica rustica]|uniref:Uncharacterized protein n=1 Tax=Hirundo rustica rustica TaxID=333673 RepID=A0A3M0IWP2_HIRRU|nr:hypothetical protein DUI87_30356 [Hirundo rustica rustica]
MVANALWGWLNRWKKANWQRRGKPIWAAEIWQDIAARVEKLTVKVRHVDAHVSKSQANEEHHNNEQVDKAAKVKVSQVDLDWQHKGEVFLARWAHDASGHQGRDATYRWARDRGVDLTMDNISQVIHNCETCAAIKQAKRVKPLWYGGRWLKYRYGEAWQIDYITLPQTRQGKRYVLTMVEATTGWLETYPVPHATARNTILGLEKQVLWRHGTPERIESDNGTHFKNGLINTWAREHGIEWIYHIPYHAPAAGKVERCNGLLKTTLKALGGGTFKNWELNLAKATWMVNTRGSINRAGPAQSEPLHTVDGDKVPVVHMKGILGKTVWINPTSSKSRPIRGIVFAQGPGSTWWPKESCLPFAGQALQVSAEAFTSDPCSLPRRQAVVPAARSLLAAVTRLLILADMVDVAYLLQHLTVFQRTFESLRNVSSKSDLQKTYQKFQKDLENLDYLAYKRQQEQLAPPPLGGASHNGMMECVMSLVGPNGPLSEDVPQEDGGVVKEDLKSSNQRDEIAAARASLKENSAFLHSICSACLEHSDVASLTASKDSICNEIQNALNVISNASQGVGNKMEQPASRTATLGSALDELENLIALDPLVVHEEKVRPSLEQRLEAIISGAALLADSSCTRDSHRERIIAECSAIRQALQELLAEYLRSDKVV